MAKSSRSRKSKAAEQVRRFELPFTAPPPILANPEVGLRNVSLRGGAYAPYTMEVTLLDAPDHRLIRAGVLLAHRITDGRGEWYLSAPEWTPWLPEERIEQMGHADLPEELADLVRPFRRGASLGPVVALQCRRQEYSLRNQHRQVVADIRQDSVSVRNGGVITARYREVTVTPIALEPRQLAWITEAFQASGATRVEEFPTLAQRLGAPSTAMGDIPQPAGWDDDTPLEGFVASLLGQRLRAITLADLALRNGGVRTTGAASPDRAGAAYADLIAQLRMLRHQVRGLAPVLERSWVEDVDADIVWVIDGAFEDADNEAVVAKLNGERYLHLMDRIVAAARAPRLGNHASEPTGATLERLLTDALSRFDRACDVVSTQSADEVWLAALAAGERVLDTCTVLTDRPKRTRQLRRRVTKLMATLEDCVGAQPAHWMPELEVLSPHAAFDLGRQYERAWVDQQVARADFADQWDRYRRKTLGPADGRARPRRTPAQRRKDA